MGRIRQLDTTLSNMIAAGEVVENMASVVKELLENAIDAESTHVSIELKEAGLRLIKITDDGFGMDKDDMEMALKRHATSKIMSEHDLHHIGSLGFRGEALPSIASVSEMTLESSIDKSPGTFMKINSGEVLERGSGAARKGTTVKVTNLFYNTPARLKHLRSVNRELSNIQHYVQKIALAHRTIAITLINDGKTLLKTTGDGSALKILNQMYPTEIIKNMLEFEGKNQYFTIRGYASKPEHTRSSRDHMMVMANRRLIRDTSITNAVLKGYRTHLFQHKYPIIYLEIEVDPILIDVNIHPQKLSIKFSEQRLLESLISDTLSHRLNEETLVPEIKNPSERPPSTQMTFESEAAIPASPRDDEKQDDMHYHTTDAHQAHVRENGPPDTQAPTSREASTHSYDEDHPNRMTHAFETAPPIKPSENRVPHLEYIGQMHGTYLLFQNEKGLYLMDQHAAAERIRYEQYFERMRKQKANVQTLTTPFIIRLSSEEVTLFDEFKTILESFGIEASRKDHSSLYIHTVPSWFLKGMEETYTETMIRHITANQTLEDIGAIIDPLAKDLSCKHSIRANKYITKEEVDKLLSDLRKASNPFTCPHGRPTIIHFSSRELETFFKRVA